MDIPLSLEIDGIEFSRHPFLPSDFILDGEVEEYSAKISFNGILIFDKFNVESWSSSMFVKRALRIFGDDDVYSVELSHLR